MQEVFHARPGEEKGGPAIDVDHTFPCLFNFRVIRIVHADGNGNAGIVDKNVDVAKLLRRRISQDFALLLR